MVESACSGWESFSALIWLHVFTIQIRFKGLARLDMKAMPVS
jgi:hypothetical protein